MSHLAAALQVPWLPGTVLVPVTRVGDPQRPVDALRFGERVAPRLLDANPEVVLHHMHDPVQDELMVVRMTYFRTKWRTLPDSYARFLAALAPGAPVVLVEDTSAWPVVRAGDRAGSRWRMASQALAAGLLASSRAGTTLPVCPLGQGGRRRR